MAYSYKGSINFGFVYIPITLHNAIKENNIAFNLLDKKTKSKIKYIKTCQDCNKKEVPLENIVKGYEYEKGKYVIFEKEDFEKLKSKKEKSITIEQFVNLSEIDPIYYQKTYYVNPTSAHKAFLLLLQTMQEENKAGIAKIVLGTKETLAIIYALKDEMMLSTLYFENEILASPKKEIKEKISPSEIKLAKNLIEAMTFKFEIHKYKDEYAEKIKKAIYNKVNGKKIVAVKEKKDVEIVDLMEALKTSLEKVKKPKKTKSETLILPQKKQRPISRA